MRNEAVHFSSTLPPTRRWSHGIPCALYVITFCSLRNGWPWYYFTNSGMQLRSLLLFVVTVVAMFGFWLPEVVSAQGLVPACPAGQPGCAEQYAPENYGYCEAVVLFSNVLRFIVAITAIIVAIIVVYAGILFTTSRGNPTTIAKGKAMFVNAVIGLVIAMTAYLIINTILAVLLGQNNVFVQWRPLQGCSYQNQTGVPTYDITTQSHPGVLMDEEGNPIYSDNYVGGAMNDLLLDASGACDDELLSNYWGSQAGNAQCIITAESACGSSPISRTDIGADNNPFSFGAMQINTTVHNISGCSHLGIADLNCRDAWSGRNYDAVVVNEGLYQDCAAALSNNECSMINGMRIYGEAGNSWSPWSTAKGCGL